MDRQPALVAALTAATLSLSLSLSLTAGPALATTDPAPSAARGSFKPLTVLDPDVDAATEAPSFTWKLRRFDPKKAKARLQTRVPGSGWANVAKLPARTGSLTAPQVSLGVHEYRIRVNLKRSKRPPRISRPVEVFAYGPVPLGAIGDRDATGTVAIGSTDFAYDTRLTSGAIVQIPDSSCSTLSVTVGSPTRSFEVRPQGGAPVDVAAGTLQTVQVARSSSGLLQLTVLQTAAQSSEPYVYASGTGYCYTPDGRD